MANYKLDIFFANGASVRPFEERICAEIQAVFREGMGARNPKQIIAGPRYAPEKDAVEVTIFSEAELSSPGHLLANVSKRLLRAEERAAQGTDRADTFRAQLVGGKRLFRIVSCEEGREETPGEISNYKLIETVVFLTAFAYDAGEKGQGERNIPRRNQANKILRALKDVIAANAVMIEDLRKEEQK